VTTSTSLNLRALLKTAIARSGMNVPARVVSGLTAKRIVSREADANDARGIRLSLTPAGKKLYRKLIGAAAERNDAFLDCLSGKERAAFDEALAKLSARAREFIARERSAQ